MDSYGPPEALYYISYALQCLVYIAGIVAGVIAITRKRTLPGILAAAGFFLLGLNLVISIITWNVVADLVDNYGTLNWASFCISVPLILLGVLAVVISVFMSAGKKKTLPPPPRSEENLPGA
jgi:hypothetical protein